MLVKCFKLLNYYLDWNFVTIPHLSYSHKLHAKNFFITLHVLGQMRYALLAWYKMVSKQTNHDTTPE